jgi:hypothetical protein
MSLIFQGPGGSFERRWIVYAMLRDNVQHHLEGGAPSGEFSALHTLGEALSNGEVTVPAPKLRSELLRARVLLDRPADDLAVSVRTRAACNLSFPLPAVSATALAAQEDWTVPFPMEGAETLGDLLGSFLEELLRVATGASDSDVVRAIDQ